MTRSGRLGPAAETGPFVSWLDDCIYPKFRNLGIVKLAELLFDAGPVNSPVLLQVGTKNAHKSGDPTDPTSIQDVFFRIGGRLSVELPLRHCA